MMPAPKKISVEPAWISFGFITYAYNLNWRSTHLMSINFKQFGDVAPTLDNKRKLSGIPPGGGLLSSILADEDA
jgi:hypothetical protein